MWHEARKQERMIRGMIVDYRRRAERRKDFYEKIKAEPTQFLQLHGRPCKIHLDPAIAAAGDSPAIMMPWQGDNNNLIDRFDVRAHLDYIPDVKNPDIPVEELSQEERQCNYERYRILAQNSFLVIGEDKFLQQLAIEEQFGVTIEEKEAQKGKLQEKKGTGAAIGYNYNDPSAQPTTSNGPDNSKPKEEEKDSDDDSDLEIIDVDLSIDVNKVEATQAHELNAVGPLFGMAGCDLFSFLTGDADDAEHQKQLMREEKEKAMFSGRKSRRERRAHRDKKLATRVLSPPSYAAPSSENVREQSRSLSRSPSPYAAQENIQFITSFGGDDDEPKAPGPSAKPLYADKVKQNLKSITLSYSGAVRGQNAKRRSPAYKGSIKNLPKMGPHRPLSRSLSRSPSKSRSRSRSYSHYSISRSRSRSFSPRYRRSRSTSRSRDYRNRSRSHSPTNQSSSYARHNSRSISADSVDKSKPTVPRYYGRRKDEGKSSSELSLDSDSSETGDGTEEKTTVGGKLNTNQNQLRLTGSSTKGSSRREALSLKERLKKKMQAQLARQLRADKKAEAARLERENRLQARRDEEMRELAIKLRRRQREMRHQMNQRSSDDSDASKSCTSSEKGSPDRSLKKSDRGAGSKSPTPVPKKKVPVWESEVQQNLSRERPDSAPMRHREPFDGSADSRENLNRNQRFDRSDGYHSREQGETQNYHRQQVENSNYNRQNSDHSNYSQEYNNRHDGSYRQHYGHGNRGDYGHRSNYSEQVQYDDQWEHEGYRGRGRGYNRRPYARGGGYRGNNRKFYGNQSYEHGYDGNSWQANNTDGQYQGNSSNSHDRKDKKDPEPPNKIRKLVDY